MLYSILNIRTNQSVLMHEFSCPVVPPTWATAFRVTTFRYTASRLATCWLTNSKYCFNLARIWPPTTTPNTLDHSLQLSLQSLLITASKISRSGSSSEYLQTLSIPACRCISNYAGSWYPVVSPTMCDYDLQSQHQPDMIITSECICISSRWRTGDIAERQCKPRIISTPLHLTMHRKEIPEKVRLLLDEHRKRMRGYEWTRGYDKPYKVRVWMIAWQELVTPWPGNDTVRFLVNKMMSMYRRVCQIYTGYCGVHLYMYIYRKTSAIHAIVWCSQSCYTNKNGYDKLSALQSLNSKIHNCENMAPSLQKSLHIGHSWPCWLLQTCVAVFAGQKVSHRPAMRSQQRLNWTFLIVKVRTIVNAPPYLQMISGAPETALTECEWSSWWFWEYLEVPTSIGEGWCRLWECCVWLPDQFRFRWCSIPSAWADVTGIWWLHIVSAGRGHWMSRFCKVSYHIQQERSDFQWIWNSFSSDRHRPPLLISISLSVDPFPCTYWVYVVLDPNHQVYVLYRLRHPVIL